MEKKIEATIILGVIGVYRKIQWKLQCKKLGLYRDNGNRIETTMNGLGFSAVSLEATQNPCGAAGS